MAHRPVRRWMLDRLGVFRGAKGRAAAAEPRCRGWPPVPMAVREECDQLGVSYYDTLLPIREPGPGLRDAMAGLRLPYRALASIVVPAGRVGVAFVSDSAQLSRLFAANWAQAGTGQEPDATLYALVGPACRYGLDESWDRARWWSADH